MLSANAKATIQKEANGSKIMSDNVKVSIDDIVNKEITITDYERIDTTNEKTGEPEHFFVIASADLPGSYFSAGSGLCRIIDAAEAQGEDIRGERIMMLSKIRTKTGQTYTPVKLL